MSTVWASREEAWEYLNTRYYMDEQSDEANDKLINDLMEMTHRPWCRTHMAQIAPNYGADCTCDGKYLNRYPMREHEYDKSNPSPQCQEL